VKTPRGFILVGYVDEDGRLRELNIPRGGAHMAREKGWYVFEDFEDAMRAPSPQADGDGDDGA
jgi:hypothetical protein